MKPWPFLLFPPVALLLTLVGEAGPASVAARTRRPACACPWLPAVSVTECCRGEDLAAVAWRYYGDVRRRSILAAANHLAGDPAPGRLLWVPVAGVEPSDR